MTMSTSLTKEKECFRRDDLFVYKNGEQKQWNLLLNIF